MADLRAPLGALLCAVMVLGPQAGTALAAPKPKPTASPGATGGPGQGRGQGHGNGKPAPPTPTAAPTSRPTTAPRPAPAVAPSRAPVVVLPREPRGPAQVPAAVPAATPAAPRARTAPRRLAAQPARPAGVAPVAKALTGIATNDPQLPLGILVVVATFLLVQGRIDRKDPKLTDTATDDLVFNLPRRPQEVVAVPRQAAKVVRVAVAPDPTSLS